MTKTSKTRQASKPAKPESRLRARRAKPTAPKTPSRRKVEAKPKTTLRVRRTKPAETKTKPAEAKNTSLFDAEEVKQAEEILTRVNYELRLYRDILATLMSRVGTLEKDAITDAAKLADLRKDSTDFSDEWESLKSRIGHAKHFSEEVELINSGIRSLLWKVGSLEYDLNAPKPPADAATSPGYSPTSPGYSPTSPSHSSASPRASSVGRSEMPPLVL